jgi:uncharacterized protein YjiS (DUF1127 family)
VRPQEMMMTNSALSQASRRSMADAGAIAVKRLIGIIREWWRRASSRRELMALDTRDLWDLRLTRADAMKEGGKSFWKD